MPLHRRWSLLLVVIVSSLTLPGIGPAGLSAAYAQSAERAQPPPNPTQPAPRHRVFRIQVVDKATGRGVPSGRAQDGQPDPLRHRQ